jgi:hypothetical protein
MGQPTEQLRKLKLDENNTRKVADIKRDYIEQRSSKGNKFYNPNYKPGNTTYDADEAEFTRLDNLAKEAKLKFDNTKEGFELSKKQKSVKDNVVKNRLSDIQSGTPPVELKPDGTPKVKPDPFKDLLANARADLKAMSPSGRLDIANKINSFSDSKVPVSGGYTDALLAGYQGLISGSQAYYNLDKNFPTVESYIAEMQRQRGIIDGGGTGSIGGGTEDIYTPQVDIASATEASSVINNEMRQAFGRDATSQEISTFTNILNKIERANPVKRSGSKGGKYEYSGGVGRDEIIRQLIQSPNEIDFKSININKETANSMLKNVNKIGLSSEFAQRKNDKTITGIQNLQTTAQNNGLTLLPSQIETYKNRLKNGENLETIKANIRAIAAGAMPENVRKLMDSGSDLTEVYQPYRQSMAAILEIPFDKIDLNDPTLTNAITDEGNMTFFDFKKSLRKDPRWPYTDNARKTVSSGLTQVLKDFGFMG